MVDHTVFGHGQVDGPTEPTDLDRTAENKALVAGFTATSSTNGGNRQVSPTTSPPRRTSSTARWGRWPRRLGAFLGRREGGQALDGQPGDHRLIGSDFVATFFQGGLRRYGDGRIDLFRVSAGKIVEHWMSWNLSRLEDELVNSGSSRVVVLEHERSLSMKPIALPSWSSAARAASVSITIQLLRATTDLTVITTASRPETQDWVRECGAHHVIDHRQPLAPQVEALGLGAPGFVFSTTQTDRHLADIVELIAPQGRLGLIDDPEGSTPCR